jgi:hypothetical protein
MNDIKTTIMGVLGLVSTTSVVFFRKEFSPELIELLATAITGILSVGLILARDAKQPEVLPVIPPEKTPVTGKNRIGQKTGTRKRFKTVRTQTHQNVGKP